ncbi:uncharacterized protein LOC111718108 [Eurytemora carolleeae]|uniref:uncharacterized protein LOC111718108 n=1 Tax=Eurytemora carolleeae TaxID=1294199 RepID=UPI000C78407E|nr:uncharacterized protein LOC111718108 [Eurytemora carolleeae]|eukprot:XP_023349378.1 uncharacterized protein LOC111718108 [Eurytemora affinis]
MTSDQILQEIVLKRNEVFADNDAIRIKTGQEYWKFYIEKGYYRSPGPDFRYYYYERPDSNISSPLFTEKNKNSGVCYKFQVPEFLWKKGVSQIYINTKVNTLIGFSHYGQRSGIDNQDRVFLNTDEKIYLILTQQHFERIRVHGKLCNSELNTGFDSCNEQWLHDYSVAEYGCISPWNNVPSNYSVCKNKTCTSGVNDIVLNWVNGFNDSMCGSPCESSEVMFASQFSYKVEGMGYGYLAITFKQSVKVTRSSIPYGFLEMLAEVGGYVGLFLGVSIQQLVAMPETFIDKIYKIQF